jgi:hypothetical protein
MGSGKPIVAPHELKIPEKVGQKISFLDRLKFVLIIITRIFGLYRIRGSVVDAGLSKVSSTSVPLYQSLELFS